MPNPDDLIAILDRILNGSRDESEIAQLRQWFTVSGTTLQFVSQDGKFNTNIGQVLQGEIHIGDRHYQFDLEALRELLQPTTPALDIDWHAVSQAMLEERLLLTTNPLMSREGISYRTEQVYVPLGLVERKKIPRRKRDVSPERGSELYREGGGEERDADMVEEIEVTQRFEHEEFLEQVIRQRKSQKSQGNRIAIIGEPGAGKTTLLQQIAKWICTEFPESIVIWISLADLQSNTLESYLEKTWLQSIIREAGGAKISEADERNFSDQFKQGRVWLLLDGLDEIQFPGNSLSEIQRQIQEGGWLRQARLILTCRLNLWDGNYNSLAGFDTYRTLDFSYPAQVEQFIQQWFAPRRKKDLGQALCSALKEPGRERIRDLVKNPLRLTLLCFSWYLQQGKLPETQAELYQKSIDRFYEWKQEQFPTTFTQRESLNHALAELSWQAIDDTDNRQQARFRLRHDFVCRHLDKPLSQGQKTLLDLALGIGWLNQVGVDADDPEQRVYAFFHPTFEEYFAAISISDGKFFFNPIPKNPMAKEAIYRIFEPQWKQVFLLWLGRKDETLKSKKEALIQSLVNFRDRCGGFYSDRAFLLAAIGIAEFKDCSFSDDIINQLMDWKFGSSNLLKRGWELFLSPGKVNTRQSYAEMILSSTDSQKVIQALTKVLESTFSSLCYQKVSQAPIRKLLWNLILIPNLDSYSSLVGLLAKYFFIQDANTSWSAAHDLERINPDNETAVQVLRLLLEITQNKNNYNIRVIRERAVKSLGQLGFDNENAIQILVWVLTTDKDARLCEKAADSLGEVNVGNETAIQALAWVLEIIQDKSILKETDWDAVDADPFGNSHYTYVSAHDISCSAIKSLGKIGVSNKIAIRALVRIIESTQDETQDTLLKVGNPAFWQAIGSLGEIADGDETAILILVKIIETTQDESIFSLTTESLGKISIGNETAIKALVRVIETTRNETVCCSAAETLSTIGTENELAKQALICLLKIAQDELTRLYAAYSLGKIDPVNEIAIRALVHLLETTRSVYVYLVAALNLGLIDPDKKIAVSSLVQILETTQDEAIFLTAAEILCTINPSSKIAVSSLVQILETTQDEAIFLTAAEILCKIDPNNKTAIPTLLKILKVTKPEKKSYKTASDVLIKIGVGDKVAIQELACMLNAPRDWDNFSTALKNLSAVGVGNETAYYLLLEILKTSRSITIQQVVAKNLNKINAIGDMTTLALVRSLRRRTLAIKELYQLMVKCAETKPYRDFYQVFRSYPWTYWIYRNLELLCVMIKRSPLEFYFRVFNFWEY
ncbi:HEAT repeat domain-containing protein [Coleofasciculus sp. FACHB-129]|uniref:HEAT repeat domain-containing protein n=1 Tax=Cyanophyceae TaxID=3028117 RepID=UPI001688FF80|nr:HEAT repeat domain-containing protein [Coleofasciculus sp. FACHB-129]MBD1895526.1 HEAT repeat domain-containing protein [Coleofasciculus sp. FACHB-129]